MTRERYCKEKHHLKVPARREYCLYSIFIGSTDDATYISYYYQINQKWVTFIEADGVRSWNVACFQDKIYVMYPVHIAVLCLQTLQYSSELIESPCCVGISLHERKIYFFGGQMDDVITDNILCLH